MDEPLFLSKSNLIRGTLPAQRNAEIVPMPTLLRFDPLLDGKMRFAYAVGNTIAAMVSNTEFNLLEAAVVGNASIKTADMLEDLSRCLIMIDQQEAIIVQSQTVDRDEFNRKVVTYNLESEIKFNHTSDVECVVEAFEVFSSSSDVPYTARTLQLSSTKPIVAGDQLAKLVNASFNAVLSNYIDIQSVTLDSMSGAYYNYTLTLSTPLGYSLTSSDRLFVKATLAYMSNKLQMITDVSHVHVDAMSGKTFGQGQADIAVGVTTYDVCGNKLESKNLTLNDVITLSNITVNELASMQQYRGFVRISSSKLTCVCDADGLFCLGSNFPKLELKVGFVVEGYGKLIVETSSGTTTVDVAGSETVDITTLTEHLVLRFVSTPKSTFKISNLLSSSNRIHSMTYSLRPSTASGEEFELSGLLLKPALKSISNCLKSSQTLDLNMGFVLT
jgi:hypothetical protein